MNTNIKGLLAVLALVANTQTLCAESATWNLNPVNNDWNTAANWTPATVPTDIATFDISTTTDITVTAESSTNSIVFNSGASEFTVRSNPAVSQSYMKLTVTEGITNNSGLPQNFVAGVDTAGNDTSVSFTGSATTGTLTSFTTEANPKANLTYGGTIDFFDNSSAGDSSFYNNGSALKDALAGVTDFIDNATAANGTFVNGGGTASGANGGVTWFFVGSDAGNALITSNPGTVRGAFGGITTFEGKSHAANATLIANGGVNGAGGGSIQFDAYKTTEGEKERVMLFGNGFMDVSGAETGFITIGSLEGDGVVFLGDRALIIGSNDLSTSFSGVIQNYGRSGSVSKIGQGSLTLSGANIYVKQTLVSEGTLIVANTTGSATGASPVQVDAGALGGSGSIDGIVTIGSGSGPGAVLAPSVGASQPATLTLRRALIFNRGGTYSYKLNTISVSADQVIANGVTIDTRARFKFQAIANRRLPIGTIFTVISNTSANPITGTFANLPDNSTFIDGRNKFQVSYEGGDGNDLTLTVMP